VAFAFIPEIMYICAARSIYVFVSKFFDFISKFTGLQFIGVLSAARREQLLGQNFCGPTDDGFGKLALTAVERIANDTFLMGGGGETEICSLCFFPTKSSNLSDTKF